MGKLKGIFKVEGTVGAVNFAKTKNGIIVREKGGVPAGRIATDPAFARTRENNAEFGAAGRAAKLLYDVLRTGPIQPSGDAYGRLLQATRAALAGDTTHPRGQRTVAGGDLSQLVGYELSAGAALRTVLRVPFATLIEPAEGYLAATLPAFDPAQSLRAPVEATHFEVLALGAILDFAGATLKLGTASSGKLPVGVPLTGTTALDVNLALPATGTYVLALGLAFYQQVNGTKYPLNNGACNAMAIVAATA